MGTVSTLTNFGVPINGTAQGPIRQPKPKYRFTVTFQNLGAIGNTANDLTLNIDSTTLPTVEHEEVAVHAYNSVAYYAGKAHFNTIEIVVRDDVANAATANIGAQLQLQFDHINQVGFTSATNYKFGMMINVMDGSEGTALETWTLEGCFLTSVSYGDMNYSNSEAKTISMTVRFDQATYANGSGTTLMASPGANPGGLTL